MLSVFLLLAAVVNATPVQTKSLAVAAAAGLSVLNSHSSAFAPAASRKGLHPAVQFHKPSAEGNQIGLFGGDFDAEDEEEEEEALLELTTDLTPKDIARIDERILEIVNSSVTHHDLELYFPKLLECMESKFSDDSEGHHDDQEDIPREIKHCVTEVRVPKGEDIPFVKRLIAFWKEDKPLLFVNAAWAVFLIKNPLTGLVAVAALPWQTNSKKEHFDPKDPLDILGDSL
ncbi:MAG: hypothetical protein SGCHY_002918 [Lobulomycetales sp.]